MEANYSTAMDIVAKMAVEKISKEENKNPEDVLISFMESNTGASLYDDSTKMWWDGPAAIAEEYINEMNSKK